MKIVIFLVSCLLGLNLNSTWGYEDGQHNGLNKVPHNDNKMLEDMSEDVAEQDYEGNYQFFFPDLSETINVKRQLFLRI